MIQMIDFWSPTCGYCKQLGPALVEFARNNQDSVEPVSVNTTLPKHRHLLNQYDVKKVPTVVLVKYGREVARTQGLNPPTAEAVRRWVAAHEPGVR